MDAALIEAAFSGIPAEGHRDLAACLRSGSWPCDGRTWPALASRIHELQQIVAQNALVAPLDEATANELSALEGWAR
jgi:hypothetical protein